MDNSEALGVATLWASVHMLRVLVNRGLVSPNEVDQIYGSILEGLHQGEPTFAATFETQLDPLFSELSQWSERLWIGRGQSNPE